MFNVGVGIGCFLIVVLIEVVVQGSVVIVVFIVNYSIVIRGVFVVDVGIVFFIEVYFQVVGRMV